MKNNSTKSNKQKKSLTNSKTRKRKERYKRDSRVRLIKKYRGLCISQRFIEYAYQKRWNDEMVDAAALIKHRFFIQYKKVSKGGWLKIPAKAMEGEFGSEYRRIRENLIESGFLEKDEIRGYRRGCHCTFYRLCPELRDDEINAVYYPKSKTLQEQYIKNKRYWKSMSEKKRLELGMANIDAACSAPDQESAHRNEESYYDLVVNGHLLEKELETIKKLAKNAISLKVKIDDAVFLDLLQKKYEKKKPMGKIKANFENYAQREQESVERLMIPKLENIDARGRFYTPMTSMRSELWDFTTFKGKQLVGVDVRSSHPHCFLVLLKDIHINYFGGQGSHEERLSSCQLSQQIKMIPGLVDHLHRMIGIYEAGGYFEYRKQKPDNPTERKNLRYSLFKKFTTLHNKALLKTSKYVLLKYFKNEPFQIDLVGHLFQYHYTAKSFNVSRSSNSANILTLINHVVNVGTNNKNDKTPSEQENPNFPWSNNPTDHHVVSNVNDPDSAVGVSTQGVLCQEVMTILRPCGFRLKMEDTLEQPAVPDDLFQSLFFPSLEEMEAYETILQGDIYLQLMKAIGMNPKERDAFKTSFLTFLNRKAFSRNNGRRMVLRENGALGYEGIKDPVRASMEKLFPSIVHFLDLCKCRSGTFEGKGGHHRMFSHAIQRIESKLMLEACANLWKKYPKMFLTTVHDCVKCLPKDAPKVEAELKRTFEKYHVSPKFEVKPHERPSDVNG